MKFLVWVFGLCNWLQFVEFCFGGAIFVVVLFCCPFRFLSSFCLACSINSEEFFFGKFDAFSSPLLSCFLIVSLASLIVSGVGVFSLLLRVSFEFVLCLLWQRCSDRLSSCSDSPCYFLVGWPALLQLVLLFVSGMKHSSNHILFSNFFVAFSICSSRFSLTSWLRVKLSIVPTLFMIELIEGTTTSSSYSLGVSLMQKEFGTCSLLLPFCFQPNIWCQS